MLIPYRSESDPEVQGEGSIDPLGLATVADRLADWIIRKIKPATATVPTALSPPRTNPVRGGGFAKRGSREETDRAVRPR